MKTRRAFLKTMLTGIASFSGAISLPPWGSSRAEDTIATPAWTFDGVTGPEHWSELSPDYSVCEFGVEQSPVDLVDAKKMSAADSLTFDYRPVTAHIRRQAWTVEIVFEQNCAITIDGTRYRLEHAHFRHPSEHLLSGRALEMEIQFTHRAENGAAAMVSVFIRQGKKHEILDDILAGIPASALQKSPVMAIDPSELLPKPLESQAYQAFYRYKGSLTFPPCTEGIIWNVFKSPVEASAKQIRALAAIFSANARPVSKINQRILLEFSE